MKLKSDGHNHAMKLHGVAIEYRLSKKQTKFMVRDIKEGIEVQYTSHDNGMAEPYGSWAEFLQDEFFLILRDMK